MSKLINNNNNNNNNNNLCNNCGKQGHQCYQCKLPIISYGIILFSSKAFPESGNLSLKYLMIRRKDSFGYIDFLRGNYVQNNLEHLKSLFNEMSVEERENVKKKDFKSLWKEMWCIEEVKGKGEEYASQKKFDILKKNGLELENNEFIALDYLMDESATKWKETEWEFPKGRRNYQERDLDCALREFEEETGISKKHIRIVENIIPFEEMFIGSNHKSYKHKFFLATIDKNIDIGDISLENYQKTEVSGLQWKTIDECLESIRPYHLEKKQLITNINQILEEYNIY